MDNTTPVYFERPRQTSQDFSSATVALHVLCAQCKKFVNESSATLQTYISKVGTGEESEAYGGIPENYVYRTPYTMKSLQESARSGCHLCCLFHAAYVGGDSTRTKLNRNERKTNTSELEYRIMLIGSGSDITIWEKGHYTYSSLRSLLHFSICKITGKKTTLASDKN